MREAELGIAVSPREWGERLHRFVADHGGARVRTRVMRPEDVLSEQFDVLVIDDLTSYLSRRLVQQAQANGKLVLGVFDRVEFREGEERLRSLGVDAVVEAQAPPEEFLKAVGRIFVGPERLSVAGSDEPISGSIGPSDLGAEGGKVTVVGGPSGGVGRTEIAIALAAGWRYRGGSVALVDCDDLAPSIAQRLGIALHPNLRSAVDALNHRSDGLHASLAFPRHVGVEVLIGLPNPRDWIELRSSDVVEVVRELAHGRDRVVVDIGARIEDLSYHGGPDRNGLARALVSAADQVVVVGQPTPVGVARLIEWLADAASLVEQATVHCVFNRIGRSSFQQREVAIEFTRSYQPATLSFVPEDRRVSDAGWAGEAVPIGPYSKAVMALTRRLDEMQAAESVNV
ncbi:MAG: hypothetical protein P1T08_14955 [Acidimicrobiia bacterium]|nr:hypothetical protein [Acidimicrobiia bacterium]